jgi:cullin-associated NEDD8-dissociated protein 1
LTTPADRNLASECVGQYLLTRPEQFPALLKVTPTFVIFLYQAQSTSPSWHVRATFIAAIRFTMSDSSAGGRALDESLKTHIVEFFNLIKDDELEVRRQALVTLNAAAHSKPFLIQQHLSQLLELLYRELEPRKELMRVVVMGPFRHTIDDGLEARRNAYEALYSVLENLFAAIDNVKEFVAKVVKGLDDQHEIKVLCSLMLSRLAGAAPLETQNCITELELCLMLDLEEITPKFSAMLNISARDKDSVTRQDIEKQIEMRRSVIRTSVALAQLQSPGTFCKAPILIKKSLPTLASISRTCV